jgi:hypothetical protein
MKAKSKVTVLLLAVFLTLFLFNVASWSVPIMLHWFHTLPAGMGRVILALSWIGPFIAAVAIWRRYKKPMSKQ